MSAPVIAIATVGGAVGGVSGTSVGKEFGNEAYKRAEIIYERIDDLMDNL